MNSELSGVTKITKNISDTEAYTVFDHVFSKTVRSLSYVIGLKKITQPFWGRWLASGVDEKIIFRFLDGVASIDAWASTASHVVRDEINAFEVKRASLTGLEEVAGLRALSYLCNMAQWGCLPLTDGRRAIYRRCRDLYIEAETLAYGERFRRIDFEFGCAYHGNLHVPEGYPAPLVVLVHGIDGCKEEHLATELALLTAGLAVLCFDGPGQGEALLLDDHLWVADFHRSVSAAIDAVAEAGAAQTERCGVMGFSIGGMWSVKAAGADPRIKAVFDLGGPIDTQFFSKIPFIVKTRLCQVTGARKPDEIAAVLDQNSLRDEQAIGATKASVRIVHGERDRVVSIEDKVWLRDRLDAWHSDRDHSLRIVEGGDHCCTGHATLVRDDAAAFFAAQLLAIA